MRRAKQRKEPRTLGTPDKSFALHIQSPTVQICGGSNVAEQWMNGRYATAKKYRDTVGGTQKTLHSWWKNDVAYPVEKSKIM